MGSVCVNYIWASTLVFLLFNVPGRVDATTITSSPQATPTSNTPPAICEFRTINYITDSLPQLCGKSAWSNINSTAATKPAEDVKYSTVEELSSQGANPFSTETQSYEPSISIITVNSSESTLDPPNETIASTTTSSTTRPAGEQASDVEHGELNDASFLSFEEWKKQTLEKAGQANANIGQKRSGEKRKESDSFQNNLDSLGDEGEIDLDFGAFGGGPSKEEASQEKDAKDAESPKDSQDAQDPEGSLRQYRSKDAGITCKERFSYASFDAGATILKTHPGAKNPKAVLIENKDSYMLSECSTGNKFLIIELSEDIWIDTLVLANYEFFSSMIRNFRVSVSDKYPVKIEKWKDVGTYEARNSREIQAFLIENPQIWARYIRIEFLGHYGNEYYCPLSLVRVHGTRMLESWKETEAIGDEDDNDGGEDTGTEDHFIPDAVADVVQEEERLSAELKEAQAAIQELTNAVEGLSEDQNEVNSSIPAELGQDHKNTSSSHFYTPWVNFFPMEFVDDSVSKELPTTCAISDAPTVLPTMAPHVEDTDTGNSSQMPSSEASNTSIESITSYTSIAAPNTSQSTTITSPVESSLTELSSSTITSPNVTRTVLDKHESIASIAASVTSKQNIVSTKNKTTSTSSAASSLPTIQESFFKAVSRRLSLLEANSTLSLGYIEEQSKMLREAFSKVEKKQLQKTTSFLDNLNGTVLAELRVFRQQYDEIWQSTVISLESQREESRREILAISARLNILADEVIFQKRMSIVQSLLLLLCLGLVIFSRVSAAGQLDFPSLQSRARAFGFPLSPLESPPESPEYRRTGVLRDTEQWQDNDSRMQLSDGSPAPLSRTREASPPTPISTYSRSDHAPTPPSVGNDRAATYHHPRISSHLELPIEAPTGTPKTRRSLVRQQTNSPVSGCNSSLECYPGADDYDNHSAWTENSRINSSPSYPSPPSDETCYDSMDSRKPLPALPTGG